MLLTWASSVLNCFRRQRYCFALRRRNEGRWFVSRGSGHFTTLRTLEVQRYMTMMTVFWHRLAAAPNITSYVPPPISLLTAPPQTHNRTNIIIPSWEEWWWAAVAMSAESVHGGCSSSRRMLKLTASILSILFVMMILWSNGGSIDNNDIDSTATTIVVSFFLFLPLQANDIILLCSLTHKHTIISLST